MPGANRNGIRLRIELDGKSVTRLNAALRLLGEKDAPFLSAAVEDIGRRFASEVRSRAPGSMASKVKERGLKGSGAGIRYSGVVAHPGSKSMEFGRVWYWRGFQGNNRPGSKRRKGGMRAGRKFRAERGQAARPYMGVIAGDKAVGAIQGFARSTLMEAVNREWERLAAGGSDGAG